jgi:hypothetical protein
LVWQRFKSVKTTLKSFTLGFHSHVVEVLIESFSMTLHFPQLDIIWKCGIFHKFGYFVDPTGKLGFREQIFLAKIESLGGTISYF